MKKKDLNKIAELEKAIKEKYGEEAIQNPKGSWDKEKEDKYLEDLEDFHSRALRETETEQHPGFTIKKKRTEHKIQRKCPVCYNYSFSGIDDLYMLKFDCCFECYVQYVEDREQRWNSGWRPNE